MRTRRIYDRVYGTGGSRAMACAAHTIFVLYVLRLVPNTIRLWLVEYMMRLLYCGPGSQNSRIYYITTTTADKVSSCAVYLAPNRQ